MPNTGYLVRSLILSLFLQLRPMSSGFYGREVVGPKSSLHLVNSQVFYQLALNITGANSINFCRESNDISRLDFWKVLELTREM